MVRYANNFLLVFVAFLPLSAAMVPSVDLVAAADSGVWGSFWRDAGLNGCTEAFPDSLRRAIANRWQILFAAADRGAGVLDIGCGRGAALDHARRAGMTRLVGIDAAALPPSVFDLRSGIDAAALPFADRSVGIVISQFGLEYAGLLAAGAEAARVADYAVWLLLHAAEGPVHGQSRAQIDQITWLTGAADAFGRLRRHLARPTAASFTDIEAMRTELVVHAETAENTTLLEALWQAVPDIVGAASPNAALQRLAEDIVAYGHRLAAMVAAAPTLAETNALAMQLRAAGYRVSLEDVAAPPAARWLIAQRHSNR